MIMNNLKLVSVANAILALFLTFFLSSCEIWKEDNSVDQSLEIDADGNVIVVTGSNDEDTIVAGDDSGSNDTDKSTTTNKSLGVVTNKVK